MKLIDVHETDFSSLYNGGVLYKYVEWSDVNKKRIITELEIFFTDPEEFGKDENHCFKIDFEKVTDEQLRQRAKELFFVDTSNYQAFEVELLINQMICNYRNNIKYWAIQDKEERRRGLGIFSLSTKKDIPNMWKMFAEDFKGICVGLNSKELFEQSHANGGGLIQYYSKTPEIPAPFYNDNEDAVLILIETLSLPLVFMEEEEYRLFKLYVQGFFLRRQKINSKVFQEIIIGESMPDNEKNELLDIINEKLPNVKLYTARYNTDFKKVDIF